MTLKIINPANGAVLRTSLPTPQPCGRSTSAPGGAAPVGRYADTERLPHPQVSRIVVTAGPRSRPR